MEITVTRLDTAESHEGDAEGAEEMRAIRRRFIRMALSVLAVASTLVVGAVPASAGLLSLLTPDPPVKIIVQQWNSTDPLPGLLVQSLGGTITRQLPIV